MSVKLTVKELREQQLGLKSEVNSQQQPRRKTRSPEIATPSHLKYALIRNISYSACRNHKIYFWPLILPWDAACALLRPV